MRHKTATVVEGEYKEIEVYDGPAQPFTQEFQSDEFSVKNGRAMKDMSDIHPRGMKLA
jgi:hypothetical protein